MTNTDPNNILTESHGMDKLPMDKLPVPDGAEEYEVEKGLRTWNAMRAENTRLTNELTVTRAYANKLEAANDQINSALSKLTSELEHYRLLAIEARTHLRIIQGHINGACERVKDIQSYPQLPLDK